MTTTDADSILISLKKNDFAPVYLLDGDEDYYIDKISSYIESNVLAEEEKIFNQSVVYGNDVKGDDLIDLVAEYPMGSKYRVLIVREAQMCSTLKKIEAIDYSKTKHTIFVVCYKHATAPAKERWVKNIENQGVHFRSPIIYDNQLEGWIKSYASSVGLKIETPAAALIAESIGRSLTMIANQINKIGTLLANSESKEITPLIVEQNIGISKDYNNFELLEAICSRKTEKIYKILAYYETNPQRLVPGTLVATLFNFYSGMIKLRWIKSITPNIDDRTLCTRLNIQPYELRYKYMPAFRSYSSQQLVNGLHALREFDVRSKGFANGTTTSTTALLRELLFKIIH